MSWLLIIFGIVLIAVGVFWPLISKLGLGRLPATSSWSGRISDSMYRWPLRC